MNNDILIVDDNPQNLRILGQILKEQGYKVRSAMDGLSAIEAVGKKLPDLILLDVMMPPGIDGFETCKRIKQNSLWSNIPIIFVTALNSIEDKVKGFQAGAVDFIEKPYNHEEVRARVDSHVKLKMFQNNLEEIIDEKTIEVKKMQNAIIFALAKLSESRDDDTGEHLERVRIYCKILAEALMEEVEFKGSINEMFVNMIYETSPLHDIGKVAIPDNILLKPGKLTDEEFDAMKAHTTEGADTLSQLLNEYGHNAFLAMGKDITLYHHEKWDGSGYPTGLKENDIPISARIMSIVDVYDALRSKRCYKDAFSHEKSIGIIGEMKGKHFDPNMVDVFLKINEKFDIER